MVRWLRKYPDLPRVLPGVATLLFCLSPLLMIAGIALWLTIGSIQTDLYTRPIRNGSLIGNSLAEVEARYGPTVRIVPPDIHVIPLPSRWFVMTTLQVTTDATQTVTRAEIIEESWD